MAEDRFEGYDVPVDCVSYTDQEYSVYLTDMQWSKEETDYLLGLVREFDTRFPLIWDRYDFQGGPPRSLEVAIDLIFFSSINNIIILPMSISPKGPS
jgi:DNA methyltransferase 1-associated protein 1